MPPVKIFPCFQLNELGNMEPDGLVFHYPVKIFIGESKVPVFLAILKLN